MELQLPFDIKQIFSISSDDQFEEMALAIFKFQYQNNKVYKKYCDLSQRNLEDIKCLADIPFMPISFFKTQDVVCGEDKGEVEFHSSGTTGTTRSKHFVVDPTLYEISFIKAFEIFYGHLEDYLILGLLPSYMENKHSSLIYMIDYLITASKNENSGFFLNDYEKLVQIIEANQDEKKVILFGVSFALIDLAEKYKVDLSNCIIMETGGMKGRRKEMTKEEMHAQLCDALNTEVIHSEYGMTELLSQAYSRGHGLFTTPPWMKILIREYNDPFSYTNKKSGGINVIDLANIFSCSFIETEDLGRMKNDQFEILGRFDTADIRGCNLLIQ
ncbi:MAG: phenylacetate-coenzyme A ligase PaaK-like adenylate-forming protein [Arenicella sp.]